MNKLEEKIRQEEYEKLKALLGKEKADEYFNQNNYPFYAVGWAVLGRSIKNFYHNSPLLSISLFIVVGLILLFIVLNTFFYWV